MSEPTTETTDLLPCPFCGCTPALLEKEQVEFLGASDQHPAYRVVTSWAKEHEREPLEAGRSYHVRCSACNARGPKESWPWNAVKFWNERKEPRS